jgi:hypothetical protein
VTYHIGISIAGHTLVEDLRARSCVRNDGVAALFHSFPVCHESAKTRLIETNGTNAKEEASLVLRVGLIAGVVFTIALIGASVLLPIIYPKVSGDVLRLAFWGLIIMACMQPAKVVNSVLGNGILPSGGDTKFVLERDLLGSKFA